MSYKLDAGQTAALLPYPALIEALALAARQLVSGEILCPERQVVPMREGATLLSMAASAADLTVHKLVSVAPGNRRIGLPTIVGQLSVLDSGTGVCSMVLDGATVTGRRTAALSMLGIRTFLPGAPRRILLMGTGTQAENHAHAIREIHPQARLQVLGRTMEAAQQFCLKLGGCTPLAALAEMAPDTDVVITATTSKTPVYTLPAMAGRLLVGIGAFKPGDAEIGAATVLASTVVVDDAAGARHEAGDLLLAGVDWRQVIALGDALAGPLASAGRPILFKTVGCAAWDLAAARVAQLVGASRGCEEIEKPELR